MKAEELRIGNWLQSKQWGGWGQVEGIEIADGGFDLKSKGYVHQYREGKYFDLEPIPITEEILLKCDGFEKWAGVWRIEIGENLYLRGGVYSSGFNTAIDEFDLIGDRETVSFRTLKYLHELQNFIYNPETGQELTFTEK